MLARMESYLETCSLDDVLAALDEDQKNLFFKDLQVRGYHPSFMNRYFNENNIQIEMLPGDKEILLPYSIEWGILYYVEKFPDEFQCIEQE